MLNFNFLNTKTIICVGVLMASYSNSNAQGISRSQLAGQQNVITTAVPFLTITPDSRRAALGDAGVASSPDANSIFWNTASLAFVEEDQKSGLSISYAPWLRSLVPGISYNQIEKLNGVEMCKKLKILYASNNKIKGWDGITCLVFDHECIS